MKEIRRSGGILLGAMTACLIAAIALPPAHARDMPSPPLLPSRDTAEKPADEPADDPLGRTTPFGTVLGFIKAAEREDLDRASEYLDSQQLPKEARKLAQDLAGLLDAADLADLSRNPDGDRNDGLPASRERIGLVKTASGSRDILLDRAQRGKGPPVWLFSADTLKWVPRVHGELGVGWIERNLSGTSLDTRFLGIPLWRLIGILLALPLAFFIARIATGLIVPAIPGLFRRVARRPVDYPAARLRWPVNLLAMAAVFYLFSLAVHSAVSRVFWAYLAATVATIALTWGCLRLIDDFGGLFGGKTQPRLGSGGIAMARLLDKLSKALVALVGAVVLFYIAGVNLTALLAGVGIGGIAVALAAQKSLENLFGAMTIISDKPIRVGDFCRVGEFTGTVEDIGLRSTRIKTLGRSVVSVPNGQLITMSLENYSLRDKILCHQRVHLGYDTSAEQLRAIISEFRTALRAHPRVEAETARASLAAFRDHSIEVEIFAYVLETSDTEFLTVQEEILLRIMDIVHAAGARFALPPRSRPADARSADSGTPRAGSRAA